jgi:hypothetical protein
MTYYSPKLNIFCSIQDDDSYIKINNEDYAEWQNKVKTCDYKYDKLTNKFSYTERVTTDLTQEQAAIQAKQCLLNTDYMMVADTFAEMTEEQQNQLLAYRKYLRNVMAGNENLTNITELKTLKDF